MPASDALVVIKDGEYTVSKKLQLKRVYNISPNRKSIKTILTLAILNRFHTLKDPHINLSVYFHHWPSKVNVACKVVC